MKISKKRFLTIFFSALFILLGVVGLFVYEFVRIRPNNVHFTNVTSSSVTVSWNTKKAIPASVKVFEGDKVIPFSIYHSNDRFFDTRDVKEAELLAVQQTSNNIVENDDLTVSIDDFQTDIEVTDMGEYYTHHVTVTGLDPETQYSFMVGDEYLFREVKDVNGNTVVSTLQTPEEIKSPVPAYGTVKNANNQEDISIDELSPVTDAVIYFNYLDEFTGERSSVYSSSFNSSGNWYIDVSNAVGEDGKNFLDRFDTTITNILVELTIDVGPLGRWKKIVDYPVISPTDLIVINDPLMSDDEKIGISRIDSQVLSSLVKDVNADELPCKFANFCGPCYRSSLADRCTCPEATLKARGCTEESKDMEKAVQEAVKQISSGTCSGNASVGQYVYFDERCRKCGSDLKWHLANIDMCSGHKDGRVFTEPKETNPTKDEDSGVKEGDVCSSVGEEKVIGGETYICEYSTRKGYPIWVKFVKDLESNACDSVGEEKVTGGETYICEYSTRKGYPIWVKFIEDMQEEKKNGNEDEKSGKDSNQKVENPCWEGNLTSKFLTVFYDSGDGSNLSICDNKDWDLDLTPESRGETQETEYEAEDYACSEGNKCPKVNQICINESTGEEFVCASTIGYLAPQGLQDLYSVWRPRVIGEVRAAKYVSVSARSQCVKGKGQENYDCICETNNRRIDEGEYCIEVKFCGIVRNLPGKEGKICNKNGKTCHNGLCTGDIKSSINNVNRFMKEFTYAIHANSQKDINIEEYIIDQQNGILADLESGIYVFQYQGNSYAFEITSEDLSENDGEIFIYIDNNENAIYDEGDVKVSDIASSINVAVIHREYKYDLVEGLNFVSFPFVASDEGLKTAAGLLEQLNNIYGDAFYSISKFDGRWKIVGQNVEVYDNNDFQLLPGEGYMIKAKEDIDISIVGQPVQLETDEDKSPIYMTQGWNLIGLYGTGIKSYTAKTLIEDINKDNFTADNVTKWASDKQMYEGFQISDGEEYGFDYPLNILESYFVRIIEGKGNWQPSLSGNN